MAAPYKLIKRMSAQSLLFEGRNSNTSRKVVVQLITGQDDAQVVRRLGKAARLQHPNTVRLLDVGTVTEPVRVAYLVREHVGGPSLADTLSKHGKLASRETLRIIWQVLCSLHEAHGLGLTHGRIAPEHVLLERGSGLVPLHAKVVGYWNLSGQQSDPAFRPPEDRPSVQGDVFATAKLLLRCLTGETELRALRSTAAPASLHAVLEKALAAKPAERYESVDDFQHALSQCHWGDPTEQHDANVDVLAVGKKVVREVESLLPPRNALMSSRTPAIWLMSGDPAISSVPMQSALEQLSSKYRITVLNEQERAKAFSDISSGRGALPWVVVFGSMHVLTDDPLLRLLSTSAELTRLLVSSHENLDLLQSAIETGGLDMHIALPTESADIVSRIDNLMTATRRLNHHYDSVRLALRRVRDDVGKLSRSIAAGESHPANDVNPHGVEAGRA